MKNAKKAKEILEMQNLSLYSFESGEKILDKISKISLDKRSFVC